MHEREISEHGVGKLSDKVSSVNQHGTRVASSPRPKPSRNRPGGYSNRPFLHHDEVTMRGSSRAVHLGSPLGVRAVWESVLSSSACLPHGVVPSFLDSKSVDPKTVFVLRM